MSFALSQCEIDQWPRIITLGFAAVNTYAPGSVNMRMVRLRTAMKQVAGRRLREWAALPELTVRIV